MNDDVGTSELVVEDELLPGSADARRRGCRCSVLANTTAFSATVGPLVDPTCRLHSLL